MSDVKQDVLERLETMGVPFEILEHPPVHTMEDCRLAEEHFGAEMPKNLFLTPRNQSAFYLCIVRPQAHFRTADISKQIGSSRLSFGTPEKLEELLRTLPGAISPMGLMFDPEKKVGLLMDRALKEHPLLIFHPCVNTASLAMTSDAFFGKFLGGLKREITWVDVE